MSIGCSKAFVGRQHGSAGCWDRHVPSCLGLYWRHHASVQSGGSEVAREEMACCASFGFASWVCARWVPAWYSCMIRDSYNHSAEERSACSCMSVALGSY